MNMLQNSSSDQAMGTQEGRVLQLVNFFCENEEKFQGIFACCGRLCKRISVFRAQFQDGTVPHQSPCFGYQLELFRSVLEDCQCFIKDFIDGREYDDCVKRFVINYAFRDRILNMFANMNRRLSECAIQLLPNSMHDMWDYEKLKEDDIADIREILNALKNEWGNSDLNSMLEIIQEWGKVCEERSLNNNHLVQLILEYKQLPKLIFKQAVQFSDTLATQFEDIEAEVKDKYSTFATIIGEAEQTLSKIAEKHQNKVDLVTSLKRKLRIGNQGIAMNEIFQLLIPTALNNDYDERIKSVRKLDEIINELNGYSVDQAISKMKVVIQNGQMLSPQDSVLCAYCNQLTHLIGVIESEVTSLKVLLQAAAIELPLSDKLMALLREAPNGTAQQSRFAVEANTNSLHSSHSCTNAQPIQLSSRIQNESLSNELHHLTALLREDSPLHIINNGTTQQSRFAVEDNTNSLHISHSCIDAQPLELLSPLPGERLNDELDHLGRSYGNSNTNIRSEIYPSGANFNIDEQIIQAVWNNNGSFDNETLRKVVDLWFKNQDIVERHFEVISRWNTSQVTSMAELFKGRNNFNVSISDWDVGNVTTMQSMFEGASKFNQPLNEWNVGKVTNMNEMFKCAVQFNQPLNKWDVSNVETMEGMFEGPEQLEEEGVTFSQFNQPLNNWNISRVNNLSGMFQRTETFNQPLNNWNVGNVIEMGCLFGDARAFNQPLHNWNVSKVKDMNGMFSNAVKFNQPLNMWNVSSVTNMEYMFYFESTLSSVFNHPLNKWDVQNVQNMSGMFYNASQFNQSLTEWNVSSVTNMKDMFRDAANFNQSLSGWNVSSVENMESMFEGASKFNQPLNEWNVGNVTNMNEMFKFAIKFNQPLNAWSVNNVETMEGMFEGPEQLLSQFNQPLNNWNVSRVTTLGAMFRRAQQFNQPLNNWNVGNVVDMGCLFDDARAFNQPLHNWKVSKVKDMNGMFSNAVKFNQPLNMWNVSSVLNMQCMFYVEPPSLSSSFNQPLDKWNVRKVRNMSGMFRASMFNQPVNTWNVSQVTNMEGMFFDAKMFCQQLDKWKPKTNVKVTYLFNDVTQVENFVALHELLEDEGDELPEPLAKRRKSER